MRFDEVFDLGQSLTVNIATLDIRLKISNMSLEL